MTVVYTVAVVALVLLALAAFLSSPRHRKDAPVVVAFVALAVVAVGLLLLVAELGGKP